MADELTNTDLEETIIAVVGVMAAKMFQLGLSESQIMEIFRSEVADAEDWHRKQEWKALDQAADLAVIVKISNPEDETQ